MAVMALADLRDAGHLSVLGWSPNSTMEVGAHRLYGRGRSVVVGLFRREERAIRRWYRKKRWWIVGALVAIGAYNNFAPDSAVLQDQIDRLFELIPGSEG